MIKRDTAKHGMTRLKETIIDALAAGDVDVLVRRPSKSRAQEKMYHALLGEVAGQIRPSTKGLSVPEASDFIEFIYATGIEIGVNWGCSAQQIMNAVRDGQYEVEL